MQHNCGELWAVLHIPLHLHGCSFEDIEDLINAYLERSITNLGAFVFSIDAETNTVFDKKRQTLSSEVLI